jgi:hypothetical protein
MSIDLALYAMISAELAEGARPARDALGAFDLDESAWAALSTAFGEQLAADAGDEGALAIAFSAAFAAHQDRLRPVPPLTVEQWAALQYDVDSHDAPAVTLATHGLSLPDYFRLVRRWATTLGRDAALAARYETAVAALDAADAADAADGMNLERREDSDDPRGAHER